MKHTQFIICVVLFCALFQGKRATACNITTINLTNIQCNDNGTPTVTTDDYMTFSLNPVGTSLGTGYSVTLDFSILGNNGTLPIFQLNGTPATGVPYSGPITLRTDNGSGTLPLPLNNIPFILTVSDDTNSGCTQTGTGIFPIVCSIPPPPCGITTINLTNVQCNDNGTPTVTTDDYMTFSLNPVGTSLGTGYSVTLDFSILGLNSTLPIFQLNGTPATGVPYNGLVTLRTENGSGTLPLPLNNIPFILTVSDDTNSGCTQTGTGIFPIVCSTPPPPCGITTINLTNVQCNDNGTPTVTTDDYMTFSLNPVGISLGTGYSVTLDFSILGNNGTLPIFQLNGTPATGVPYSGPITLRTENGSGTLPLPLNNVPFVLTVSDDTNSGCTQTGTGIFPIVCSTPPPPCGITTINLTNVQCNDNGTPTIDTDDYMTFSLNPVGTSLGSAYSVTLAYSILGVGSTLPVLQLNNSPATGIAYGGVITLRTESGSGPLPANIPFNVPFTITVSDNTNAGCTQTGVANFPTICSTAPACTITVDFFGNPSACNDNGTPNDPTDDFFTQNIHASFFNRPSTGSLQIVSGGDQIGVYSIPVQNIVGNAHTFNSVQLKADGTPTVVQMNFTDDPSCIDADTGPTVQPCSAPPPPCTITVDFFGNPSACNDNGTPNDPTDDFFTQNIHASFFNRPTTGSLQIVPGGDQIGTYSIPVQNIIGNAHTFNGVQLKADGTPSVVQMNFTDDPGCIDADTGPTVQPCSFAPPVLNCPAAVAVSCFDAVPVANPASVSETHSCPGNVTIIHLSDVNSNIICINHLTITRTYRGTDQCGNTATCAQTITINDQTPPTVTCPVNLTLSCANQVPAIDVAALGVTDNCTGNIGISRSFINEVTSNQTCANRFTLTRTYKGGDACGNTATCTQMITVNDQTAPSLTCPAGQTVPCVSQVPLSNTSLVTGLSDNCGGTTPTVSFVSDVTSNQTCANRFTLTRTYRATDACGNSATCSQVITVNDQTGPNMTCPASQTVSCANQVPLQNIALVTGISDNCGGAIPTVTFVNDAISNQTCANRFTVTRTYRATDVCGNAATCSQVITVNDQTPPVFQNAPANVTVDCYLVPAVSLQISANDNCGSAAVTYLGEVKTQGICPVYFILTRTWLATDACGNTATSSQVITVTDDRAPQFIVQPKDVLLECGPDNDATFQAWLDSQGGAVAEDCSPIAFSYDDSPVSGGSYVDCGNTFQRTIRFTATDDCGNASFRDATFTVLDLTPPVFTHLPEDRSVQCSDSGDGSVELYEWLDSQAFLTIKDDCGAVEMDIKLIGSETGCGQTWTKKYKFTATDECGNASTAYATFRVIDDKPPVIAACPPNNLYLTCAATVPPPNPAGVVAHDQCGAVTIAVTDIQQWGNGCSASPMTVNYTYTATDACGNKTACFQQLRVLDNSVAEINIPDTVKVVCVDDIPRQYAVEAYLLGLLDGPCNATKIAVLQDLGLIGNAHSYRIQGRDGCRNKAVEQIVTFIATGTCTPLCAATSEIWGATGISFPPVAAVIDSVTNWYGGVSAGAFGRKLTIGGSNCFATLIGTGGDCSIFAAGQNVANDNNSCQLPVSMLQPDGTLRSELGANVLALQLNIWYNQHFNNRNLGVQDLKDLPACMIDFSIMKALGNHSTWQDLLNLANEYLGAANAYPYPDGFCELLNAAIANVNVLHQNCTPVPPCNNAHKGTSERSNLATNAGSLVPNPAMDMVSLWYEAVSDGPVTLRITGINGAVAQQEVTVQKGMNQIDLPIKTLVAGIYTVQVRQGETGIVLRLVKVDE